MPQRSSRLRFVPRVGVFVAASAVAGLAVGADAWAAARASSSTPAVPVAIQTFDTGLPDGFRVSDGSPVVEAGVVRIDIPAGTPARTVIRIPVDPGVDFSAMQSLAATVRATSTDGKPVALRWIVLDQQDRPVRQRPFTLPVGSALATVDEPLERFRWHGDRPGDFESVGQLALVVESESASSLEIDDVTLLPPTTPDAEAAYWSSSEVVELAFGEAGATKFDADDVLVAVEKSVDLERQTVVEMHKDAVAARRALQRLLAIEPTPGTAEPARLLVFATVESRNAFIERLGESWRATIGRPTSDGYTLQNIATASWDAKQGGRRPVFLHEAVHAILAEIGGLLPGHPKHGWLQEGIANYVQLGVYPGSIDRRLLPAEFRIAKAQGLGQGRFVPLDELIDQPVQVERYAQLATVIGYLAEERPQVLAALVKDVAAGKSGVESLATSGLPLPELEQAWLTWGHTRFTAAEIPKTPFKPLPEIAVR